MTRVGSEEKNSTGNTMSNRKTMLHEMKKGCSVHASDTFYLTQLSGDKSAVTNPNGKKGCH